MAGFALIWVNTSRDPTSFNAARCSVRRFAMDKLVAITVSAALMVLCTATGASSQSPATQQPSQHQQRTEQGGTEMGPGGMMGRGMMGGMMGPEMMRQRGMVRRGGMPGPMMRVIFALIDTDSDATISLQEWQAAHERIFKAMDTNKDGVVTLDEMRAFTTGQTGSGPQQ
jgi:hypothetical protein